MQLYESFWPRLLTGKVTFDVECQKDDLFSNLECHKKIKGYLLFSDFKYQVETCPGTLCTKRLDLLHS